MEHENLPCQTCLVVSMCKYKVRRIADIQIKLKTPHPSMSKAYREDLMYYVLNVLFFKCDLIKQYLPWDGNPKKYSVKRVEKIREFIDECIPKATKEPHDT